MSVDRKEYITPGEAFMNLIDSLRETAVLSLEIVTADLCKGDDPLSDPLSEASRHQRIAALNTAYVARVAMLHIDYSRHLLIATNPEFKNEDPASIDKIIQSQRKLQNP